MALPLPKAKTKDEDDPKPAAVKPPASGPGLTAALLQSLTMMISAGMVGAAIFLGAGVIAPKPQPLPLQQPFMLVDSGSSGIVWRLNTQTGEMIACRSLGPSGVIPNDPDGAWCWRVGLKK